MSWFDEAGQERVNGISQMSVNPRNAAFVPWQYQYQCHYLHLFNTDQMNGLLVQPFPWNPSSHLFWERTPASNE